MYRSGGKAWVALSFALWTVLSVVPQVVALNDEGSVHLAFSTFAVLGPWKHHCLCFGRWLRVRWNRCRR